MDGPDGFGAIAGFREVDQMGKLAAVVGSFEQKLRKALREGLSAAGLDAEIDIEPIHGTKLRRVHVTSAAFEKLRPSERQDLV